MLNPQPTATAYTGEVTVTLGGAARTFGFGINTMRDYTKLTGTPAGGFAADLAADLTNTMVNLVYCALKRYVPADQLPEDFTVDHAADWIDGMNPADAEKLADTVLHSVRTANPLTAALVAKLKPLTPAPSEGTDGTTSSTSPSVS